jgi:hypothetical protein
VLVISLTWAMIIGSLVVAVQRRSISPSTWLLTKSDGSYLEADSYLSGQEIACLMESEGSLPCWQQPITGHCSEPDGWGLHLHTAIHFHDLHKVTLRIRSRIFLEFIVHFSYYNFGFKLHSWNTCSK